MMVSCFEEGNKRKDLIRFKIDDINSDPRSVKKLLQKMNAEDENTKITEIELYEDFLENWSNKELVSLTKAPTHNLKYNHILIVGDSPGIRLTLIK